MTEDFLQSLTPESIMNEQLPLIEIMQDSVFCIQHTIDYTFIKACLSCNQTGNLNHFIFCNPNNAFEFNAHAAEAESGCAIVAVRNILPENLFPNKWKGIIPPGMSLGCFMDFDAGNRQYGYWIVFENKQLRTDNNLPSRFSVLYIGANPMAIFESAFTNLGIFPAMIDLRWSSIAINSSSSELLVEDSEIYRIIIGNNGGIPNWIITSPGVKIEWKNYQSSGIGMPNVNGCFWKKYVQASLV